MDLLEGAGDAVPAQAGGGMDAFADMAPAGGAGGAGGGMGGMDIPGPGAMGAALPSGASEVVREWEKEMDAKIQKKSDEELAIKKQRREQGLKDLEGFHAERKATMAKKKSTNRADEKNWIKLRDDALKSGSNPWERVVSLIDEAKKTAAASEGSKKGDKESATDSVPQADTSRFKSLLISLKSNPVAA